MRSLHKIISALLIIATMTVALSCKETFTEEDALKAQQAIDLAIYVFNQTDVAQPPITGAKVTLTQNGTTKESTTDATGGALFPGMKVGDFIYRVEATNFVTVASTGTATPSNFRQGQMTAKIGMTSTTDADMATIKGTILIEKDVTNATKENTGVMDLYFSVSLTGGTRIFTTKTDANGVYSIKVPVNATSTSVTVIYPDLELDQVVGVNKFSDETGAFPVILPRKETIKTIFSMTTAGEQNRTLPATGAIRSVYAIVDAPPASGTQATISSVTISNGVVTDVVFSSGGVYTGDADGKVNITFTSIDGGAGASCVVTLGNNASVSSAYAGVGTGSKLLSGGSGYPSSDFSLNRTTTRTADARTSFTVLKGTITVANGDYGTGIYRPRLVQ